MEKIKNFVTEHQKEIVICLGTIFVYRLGYSKGVRDYHTALCKALSKCGGIK